MMEYEIFKGVMEEKLRAYFSETMQGAEVLLKKLDKVNEKKDALVFSLGEQKKLCPTVYLNDMYRDYLKTGDLDVVFEDTIKRVEGAATEAKNYERDYFDWDGLKVAKDKIIFQLINTEQNKEMLKDMPHREFQDLSVIYRIVVRITDYGYDSVPITNHVAESMEVPEEELFSLAYKNTQRIFPMEIESMEKAMIRMLMDDGMPEELVEEMAKQMAEDMEEDHVEMYVISNDVRLNGATCMLYEEKLHELAEKLGSDMYILPSSIHEVIAIPANGVSPKELADMVRDVNRTQVELEDRLSNQVYQYDRLSRKVTLVTNTPDKRLDHYVAETPAVYETKAETERVKGR